MWQLKQPNLENPDINNDWKVNNKDVEKLFNYIKQEVKWWNNLKEFKKILNNKIKTPKFKELSILLDKFLEKEKINSYIYEFKKDSKSIAILNLHWINQKNVEKLISDNLWLFIFFKEIDIPIHYKVMFAEKKFPYKKFIGYEKNFKEENIIEIISMFNIWKLSIEEIKFVISNFELKKIWGNYSFEYIHIIKSLLKWKNKKLESIVKYIKGNKSIEDIYNILINEKNKIIENKKINKNIKKWKEYKRKVSPFLDYLKDIDVFNFLVKYNGSSSYYIGIISNLYLQKNLKY